jgi:hypothetical protein
MASTPRKTAKGPDLLKAQDKLVQRLQRDGFLESDEQLTIFLQEKWKNPNDLPHHASEDDDDDDVIVDRVTRMFNLIRSNPQNFDNAEELQQSPYG